MQALIIAFIFFQVGLENSIVKAHCDRNKGCIYKESAKTTSMSSTTQTSSTASLSISAESTYVDCAAKSKFFCLCANYNSLNQSIQLPVPKKDTCPSIGCSLWGRTCYYFSPYECNCSDNYQCNKYKCSRQEVGGCYCYFGDKAIYNHDKPASSNCSDLLREIGNYNGRYYCLSGSCYCDLNGNCVCKPPKNRHSLTTKPKQCDSCDCRKRSFEFCQCGKE